MKRLTILTIVFLLTFSIFVQGASAERIDLRTTKASNKAVVSLVETDIDKTILEVDLTFFDKDNIKVENNEYTKIVFDGASQIMEKGMPALPKYTALVAVPEGITPKIKVLEEEVIEHKLTKPLISSKGHLTRNINPESIPYTFNSVYDMNSTFPANKVQLGKVFKMRDLNGVRVVINPVRYNASKNTLEISKKMRIMVDTAGAKLPRAIHEVPENFEQVYRNNFINYTDSPMRSQKLVKGKLLVVTLDKFADAVAPYVTWKKKIGWDVTLTKLSAVGTTAEDLKAYIQGKYDEGGLAYIMLIGDYPDMPTLFGVYEKAASDPSFCKLSGDDHIPDASIGRVCASTVEEVENQIAKFVHYEQFPFTGADAAWYGKGMGIASNEGSPTDYERAEWLREAMENWRFTSVDKIYAPSASSSQVAKGVNEGRSVINYIGHGSATKWVTSNFNCSDAMKLENGRKFPVIWSVACQNGRFTMSYGDCFCEAWLKAGTKDKPAGSVAIFGASTNAAWVPPCDMQSEIIKNQMIGGKTATVGAQYLQGVLKAMEIWGTTAKSKGNMLNEQYCLFGDVSLVLRTKAPSKVDVAAKIVEGNVEVTATIDGKPMERGTITVSTEEWEESMLSKNGKAVFPVDANKIKKGVLVTVYGQDIIPVVDQLVK